MKNKKKIDERRKTKKKRGCQGVLLTFIIAAVILISVLRYLKSAGVFDRIDFEDFGNQENSQMQVQDNTYIFLSEFSKRKVLDEESAKEALLDMQEAIGFKSIEEFGKTIKQTTPVYQYYRFEQRYNGISVYGREIVIGVKQDGTIYSVTGNYQSLEGLDIETNVDGSQALEKVKELYKEDGSSEITTFLEGNTIYTYGEKPIPAWKILVETEKKSEICFLSMKNGKVVAAKNQMAPDRVMGTGQNLDEEWKEFPTERISSTEYLLEDKERNLKLFDGKNGNTDVANWKKGILIDGEEDTFYTFYDNGEIYEENGKQFGKYSMLKNGKGETGEYELVYNSTDVQYGFYQNGTLLTQDVKLVYVTGNHTITKIEELKNDSIVWTDAQAVTAMSNLEDTYDFYKDLFGREGFNGNKGEMNVIIRGLLWDKTNAASHTTKILGQFVSTLQFGMSTALSHDLIGHEYNHAVISGTNDISYEMNETGAIEEGLCDAFGEFIEDYADDGVLNNSCDWLHTSRDIGHPELSKTPSPSHYANDENWYDGNNHDDFVHQNSTLISHVIYKMSEGIVEDSKSSPVGNEKMAMILYCAIHSMPKDCSIYQFGTILRNIAYNMCQDDMLSMEQARCVYQALYEVNIYPLYDIPADAEITLYSLDGNIIDEYELHIDNEMLNQHTIIKGTENSKDVSVSAEIYRLALKKNTGYQMAIQLEESEKFDYLFFISTKEASGNNTKEYHIFTDIIPEQKVINNGSRYISYGENTYYWKYNKNSLESTGINGGFRNQDVKNQLVVRNQASMETVLLEDVGSGELYISKNRLYYETSEGWKSCLLDGTEEKKHPDYNIQTVDNSTGTLILRDTINLDSKRKGGFWIENEDGRKTLLTTDKFDLDSKLWPELILAEGGNIYYYRVHDNKDGSHNITVLGANMKGETRLVGNITIDRNGCEGLEVWGQLLDGMLYVGFTNVGGTMMNCNQGGVSSMNTQKDEAHTYIIRQDGEYSLYYPATHISIDSETGEKMLHFYNGQGMGGNARERWVASRVQKMNLETKEVINSDLPLIFTGEYALIDGDIVTVLEGADETTILASKGTLASLGYFSFDGNERATGGFKISDVTVVGNKAYIEIHQFTRAKEADMGFVYGFRRIKTVVYETEIGSDELNVLYKY